jgi:hypothetical protein
MYCKALTIALGTSALAGTLAIMAAGNSIQDPGGRSVGGVVTAIVKPDNPITRLQSRIDSGAVNLEFKPGRGYLESILRNLNIPVSSQILVFSKTSLQKDIISPRTPRAIYFNDQTYVGWMPDADLIELSTTDPRLGVVFYVLPQRKIGAHRLVRIPERCLECHQTALTGNVPGHLFRSVKARTDGDVDMRASAFFTTDRSPFEERWGGWYVTGTHGSQEHMGNCPGADETSKQTSTMPCLNVIDLRPRFDTSPYLSPHSDIVALLVAGHQIHTHNLMSSANTISRQALLEEQSFAMELGRPAGSHFRTTLARIATATEPLVKAFLFSGETRISAPIAGTSRFASDFSRLGPKDKRGRSLRDLDLTHRLLRYPCSYLIYSPAFDGLPDIVKECVYCRILDVTTGHVKSPDFSHLSAADRKAILEILTETKPAFASLRAKRN